MEYSKIENKPHHSLDIKSQIENKPHHSLDIKSHLLDITSLTFIISMLLCIFVDNNTLKIVVFSVLLMLIIIAGTYERLKEEK